MRNILARMWHWAVTLILCWVCYLAIDRARLKDNTLALVCITILMTDRIVSTFLLQGKTLLAYVYEYAASDPPCQRTKKSTPSSPYSSPSSVPTVSPCPTIVAQP